MELSWSSDQYGELVKSNRTNSGFLSFPSRTLYISLMRSGSPGSLRPIFLIPEERFPFLLERELRLVERIERLAREVTESRFVFASGIPSSLELAVVGTQGSRESRVVLQRG